MIEWLKENVVEFIAIGVSIWAIIYSSRQANSAKLQAQSAEEQARISREQADIAQEQANIAKISADATLRMANNDDERCKEELLERKRADLQLTGEVTDSELILVVSNKGKCSATYIELHYPFKLETKTFAMIESGGSITEIYKNAQDFTYGLARVVWNDEEGKKRRTYEIKSNGIGRPIQAVEIKLVTQSEGIPY